MTPRAAAHRQLDPQAWTGKGLSPVNRALAAAIVASTILAILQTEPEVTRGNEPILLLLGPINRIHNGAEM